jgi:hypothetical protein
MWTQMMQQREACNMRHEKRISIIRVLEKLLIKAVVAPGQKKEATTYIGS